jgi:hypothetical protein
VEPKGKLFSDVSWITTKSFINFGGPEDHDFEFQSLDDLKIIGKFKWAGVHCALTTISLLQKQRLNPRNYSKQELIMELIV